MKNLRQLYQWFMALEKRERLVLGGGGVILLIVIIYSGILAPYLSHRHALIARIQEQRTLLAWMHPAVNRIESLHGAQPAALPGGSLSSAVTSSVAGAGLSNALQKTQQETDGSVRMQFSGADFDSLVRWLSSLQQTYGIVLNDMTVTRASSPGLVNANIKLQGPAT